MRTSLALLLVSLVSLAGCTVKTTPSNLGMPGSSAHDVKLEVLSAKLLPGRCFDGATAFGEVCHSLQVSIDNTGYTNALDTHTFYWTANDADGAGHDFGTPSGDSVAGGKVATMKVEFTLKDGAAHLAELMYSSSQGHGTAAIPAY